MIKPFTFRALSPHHATAMDRDYLLRVIDAAGRYGFNAIQICGDTHGEGNLDGITEFWKYGKANIGRDAAAVVRRRDILQDACRAAHDRGMEVYYWHHELWYPPGLQQAYPDWFMPAPRNAFTRDLHVEGGLVPQAHPDAPIWDFIDAKFDEAFAQCPDLDGTIMTVQEARVPIYCLYEDFEVQVQALIDLYRRLEAAHRRVGKKWVVRTFAWREHEYRVVTEAVRRWRPTVPVESKGVPMDWHPFYPYDPLLAEFDGMRKHVEIAPSAEFHGCGVHPTGHPWYYTENLRFAGEHGHSGAAIRMDRAGSTMLGGPDEGVLACIGQWLNDPEGTDVGEVYIRWMMDRYGVEREPARRLVFEMMDNCWEATLRCYHHDKIYIGDSFWQRYDRRFFMAERHCCVEHDDPDPLAEKLDACARAGKAAAVVEELRPLLAGADADDLARRVEFLQLTCRSYRALVAALVARGRWMYQPTDGNMAALRLAIDDLQATGAATTAAFPAVDADGEEQPHQRQPGVLVEQFAEAFRADLPKLRPREIAGRLAAADLGANAEYRGAPAHQPGPGPATVTLQGRPRADCVLVLFAGTEMCRRRPLVVRSGDWQHRFDIGQYAWFLSHDRYRRYEVPIPRECIANDGRCEIELSVPEPDNAPYLRELRLEVEG